MEKDPLTHIKSLAKPIVEQHDLFLVDVEIKQDAGNVIWILVDSEEGNVSLKSCTKISKQLSFLLESTEIFQNPYRLNVSSPGLARPLSDLRQYPKNRGRSLKVKHKTDEGYETVEGKLQDSTDEGITLQVENVGDVSINFEEIVESKVVPKI